MFFSNYEKEISKEYLENGYIVKDIVDLDSLEYISKIIYSFSNAKLMNSKIQTKDFFNEFHKLIDQKKINDLRVNIIQKMNKDDQIRLKYYLIAKKYLDILVGNEIAMQLRINLSIQLPGDKSSLLPVHADTWSGDSPFESVVWLPLVNCYNTKSMYLLPPKYLKDIENNFSSLSKKSSEDLFKIIKDKVKWIEIKYGQILIFNQCLPHGNRVNEEKETRWSLNCRFKGIFTPYNDKKIGEFFEPITPRAVSIAGMKYKLPS